MKMKSSSSAGTKAQDPATKGESKFAAQNALMDDIKRKVDSHEYSQVQHAASKVAPMWEKAQSSVSSIVPPSKSAPDLED